MTTKLLTQRDVTGVLGAMISALCHDLADPETVREAVRWWANTDRAWEMMAQAERAVQLAAHMIATSTESTQKDGAS